MTSTGELLPDAFCTVGSCRLSAGVGELISQEPYIEHHEDIVALCETLVAILGSIVCDADNDQPFHLQS